MQENSGTHSVYVTMGASNHTERDRHPDDFYATEPAAIELLLSKEKFAPEIWECACGMGHLSEVLKAHGYNVISTDLVYRGYGDPEPLNFLSETLEDFEGDIITNPPYKYALEFVERAIESVAPAHPGRPLYLPTNRGGLARRLQGANTNQLTHTH